MNKASTSTSEDQSAGLYKLLVVDDHPVIGVALKTMLTGSRSVKEVTVASSARQGREQLRLHGHELLVVDLDLPDMAGVDLIRLMRYTNPDSKILVYSGKRYEIFSSQLENLAISGFLNKSEDPSRLVSIIELIGQGYSVKPPNCGSMAAHPWHTLTERELSIAILIVKGYSNRDVAAMLSISEKTVAVHKMNILRKTGAKNAIDLALQAETYRYV